MRKHIIFIGKPESGKSLFANMIFPREKTMTIRGRDIFHPFWFDGKKENWDYENVIIDDPVADFNLEAFYAYICNPEMIIQRRGREKEVVKTPRFIFLFDSDVIQLVMDDSFITRFKIIDFNKNAIADLVKVITDEKINIEF